MRILLAISLVAFAALLWASISIAQHIRHARRKRRHDLAERARLRAANAIARASQPAGVAEAASAAEIPAADAGHPVPPPPIPEPESIAQMASVPQHEPIAPPSRAKLTYFTWDDADSDSDDDFFNGRAASASETGDEHAAIPMHAARQANDHSGSSIPAHKER